MMSLFADRKYGKTGNIFRISAQVACGVGFLGAGMTILKNNSVITGLTTAAGIWTTSIIGIAIGYGFYIGAIAAAVFCLGATVLLSKLENIVTAPKSGYDGHLGIDIIINKRTDIDVKTFGNMENIVYAVEE